MIYKAAKRSFDVVVSLFSICVLFPLMIAIAVAVKLDSRGPVIYRGERAGLNGCRFRIMKFRTMVLDAESIGGPSTALNDPRLTRIGRFLRKFKLDELPQFFNVLLGDMSLVGPRPQVLKYTDQYQGDERLILTVRPGITDLASLYFVDMDAVLGVGDIDERYRTEVEPVKNLLRIRYVREMSMLLDIRILVETFFRMFGISGITGLNLNVEGAKRG